MILFGADAVLANVCQVVLDGRPLIAATTDGLVLVDRPRVKLDQRQAGEGPTDQHTLSAAFAGAGTDSILVEDEFGMNRDQLRAYLARYGIETRTFFIPMHLQPIYHEAFKGQRYPVSEMLCQRGFYLPSASSLTTEQVQYIVDIVRQAYEEPNR